MVQSSSRPTDISTGQSIDQSVGRLIGWLLGVGPCLACEIKFLRRAMRISNGQLTLLLVLTRARNENSYSTKVGPSVFSRLRVIAPPPALQTTHRCTRIAELLNFSVKRFCSPKYMRVFAPTGEAVSEEMVF